MPDAKPQRLRIIVYKTEGCFAVANENKNRLVLPTAELKTKTVFFDKFMIVIETLDEFVTLGVGEIEIDENGVGYAGPRTVNFVDEEGVYEFSKESKRFIRIPE